MQNSRAASVRIAKMMMVRHGLLARAVAQARADEAWLASDPTGVDRWRAVQSAIAELRNTSYAAAERPSG